MMKKLSFLLVGFVIVACVTGYNPTYRFNQVQVVNLTGATIRDVSVRVLDTTKSLSCAEVAKNAICNSHFGKSNYPNSGIELSWTHHDGIHKSESMSPHIPAYYSVAIPLRIVLEINGDGSVKPFYEQDPIGP